MAIRITYFVHGTSTDNEKEISSGWNDAELSELGVKQSKELREATKNRKFDVVFCSDLKRAARSAKIVFEGLAPIIADRRLRECDYGIYNGKSSAIVEPLQEKYLAEQFPEGESYEDVKTRVADFIEFLRQNYDGNPRTQRAEQSSHDGKHVAIVSHKAPQLALDVLLRGKTWEHAFAEDWRKKWAWQAGWEYTL